jgi:protein O-mannosyl-transferase
LSFLTYRQVGYWTDSFTLWTHTLEATHHNWLADSYLGGMLKDRGRLEEALAHYYHASAEVPREASVTMNIALIEQQRGNLPRAIEYYQKTVAFSKDAALSAQAFANMGHAYADLGDYAHARQCYEASQRPLPVVPPPPAIDWRNKWWRDLARMVRERLG